MSFKPISKRSKSECDLLKPFERRDSRSSESYEACDARDSGSDSEEERHAGRVVELLEKKIDRLSDLFLEQCRLLTEVKEEIRGSKTLIEKSEQLQRQFMDDLLEKTQVEGTPVLKEMQVPSEPFNRRARSLLDAIETKQAFCPERELREALADFLQSNELKEKIVSATVEGLRDLIRESFSADMSRIYLPLLQRAHRRLTRQLTRTLEDGFTELEANSASLSSSLCRLTRSLRHSVERHQRSLEAETDESRVSYLAHIVEDFFQTEMRQWRQVTLDAVCPPDDRVQWAERGATPPLEYPDSPPQPPRPDCSVIDQLMKTAEITKQISDGDVNAAFSDALSAADLWQVVAACRAAPAQLSRARLSQHVLLALAQQLPTDMVHDTQLKCRYLEETLLNLDPQHPATRAYLPLVVGEIQRHLTAFLAKYPGHTANKRIMLIIMAAKNLLK